MPIRWKVTTQGRRSALANHFPGHALSYRKGTRVEAHPDSIGIVVFETRERARKWLRYAFPFGRILKVKAIGRGIKPKHGLPQCRSDYVFERILEDVKRVGLRKFLVSKAVKGWCSWSVPNGTLLYKEVEVLE